MRSARPSLWLALLIVSLLVVPAHHGDGIERVLLIGLNKQAELYLQRLSEQGTGRVRIAGLLGDQGAQVFRSIRIRSWGNPRKLPAYFGGSNCTVCLLIASSWLHDVANYQSGVVGLLVAADVGWPLVFWQQRPGLTGWAQIKGGRHISPADKAALDVWYVRNLSFTLDLKILFGTVPMLIFGEQVTEAAIIHARREVQLARGASRTVQQENQLI